MRRGIAFSLFFLSASLLPAQNASIDVEPVECLAIGEHTPVMANVSGVPGGGEVRLYFRRLHEEVEDFYYVRMEPSSSGWWAMLPRPENQDQEDRELAEPANDEEEENAEAAWWKTKDDSDDRDPNDDLDEEVIRERASMGKDENRDWMDDLELDELEAWFVELENEPAEMYVTVVDANGRELVSSPVMVSQVRDDCDNQLTPQQEGFADNLVIGETAPWQEGEPVFHWECEGIVTRRNHLDILREDEFCRACVVALWGAKSLLPLVATASVIVVTPRDEPVSPMRP